MTETELAYAAGIVDGEGCFNIRLRKDRATYQAAVVVGMVHPAAPVLLHSMFGGNLAKRHYGKHGRSQTIWTVQAIGAQKCAEALLPYLRVKTQQALNVIEIQKLNVGPRQRSATGKYFKTSVPIAKLNRMRDLYLDNQRLNQRGSAKGIQFTSPLPFYTEKQLELLQ